MKLSAYIAFNGNCEKAIRFYKDVFDGELTGFMRFRDAPDDAFKCPDTAKDLVMHATLTFNGCTLFASDNIGDQMTVGNNFSLSFNADDELHAQTIFSSLQAHGGTVIMPLETVFWGGKFGMLQDSFGIQWMVSCNE